MIDRILFNARIYTQSPNQPWAQALAIMGERIVAIGNNDSIKALASATTQLDDVAGQCVIPGLTDAHLHLKSYARLLQSVNLIDVPSKAASLEQVKARVAATPSAEWVSGIGWRKDAWLEGNSFPTAADLDAISTQHPIYLADRSGHAAWVNSLALRMAGITDSTPDPIGGQIQRGADGKATGILFEDPAMSLVKSIMPKHTSAQIAEWLAQAQAITLRMGLTGIHDFDNPDCMAALQILREQGSLHTRIVKQINVEWIEYAYELGVRSGFGDDWLRFGGLKIFADGALGPQTALMLAPYDNDPTNYGIAVTDKEEMYALISKASANGLLSTVHAIGDKAVHDVLDVYEAVRQEEAQRGIPHSRLRHRIEHVQIIHPDDVTRLAALGVIASMQPIHATSDYQMADYYWGARAAYSYAPRKQLKAGAVLALGSDAPLDDINPLAGIYAAITRRRADGSPGLDGWYPEERLTLAEALHAYTVGPSYAAYMEDRLGQLAVGFLADLVVLDHDWFTTEPAAILDTKVLGTMVGGSWRYRDF